MFVDLREYGPLKQGLRLGRYLRCLFFGRLREYGPLKQGLRQDTRRCFYHRSGTPRVWSTKTRIKTNHFSPLQSRNASPRVWSTKTRIKTFVAIKFMTKFSLKLREYGPLKQGLRPSAVCSLPSILRLREYGPLKQGLRPD